jgi:hypothetical protein
MFPTVLLNTLYLSICISAATLVIRNRWSAVQPGLSAFLVLNAIQATNCVLAGDDPSIWWWTSVWTPVEIIVLESAILAAMEVTWNRYWMVGAGLVGAILLPCEMAALREMFHDRWGMVIPAWYTTFLAIREWIWISVALCIVGHSLYLLARPKPLPPAVYRSRWLFGLYAGITALCGAGWPVDAPQWIERRMVWRGLVACVLLRWCLLTCSVDPWAWASRKNRQAEPHA